jgi:high-affinity K+ transport system ATPase subunit B
MPATGVSPETLADAAQLASLADETPEGSQDCRVGEGESSACESETCRL